MTASSELGSALEAVVGGGGTFILTAADIRSLGFNDIADITTDSCS